MYKLRTRPAPSPLPVYLTPGFIPPLPGSIIYMCNPHNTLHCAPVPGSRGWGLIFTSIRRYSRDERNTRAFNDP